MTNLEVEIEEISTEDEEVSEAKGREEAVSSSETGGSGAFMAIGAGGGSAGAFGNHRWRQKTRPRCPRRESRLRGAVDAAYVIGTTSPTACGMWMATPNCTLAGAKCEPGVEFTGADGDAAMTGYAVLAFLGGGYDHRTPKYRATVQPASTG